MFFSKTIFFFHFPKFEGKLFKRLKCLTLIKKYIMLEFSFLQERAKKQFFFAKKLFCKKVFLLQKNIFLQKECFFAKRNIFSAKKQKSAKIWGNWEHLENGTFGEKGTGRGEREEMGELLYIGEPASPKRWGFGGGGVVQKGERVEQYKIMHISFKRNCRAKL